MCPYSLNMLPGFEKASVTSLQGKNKNLVTWWCAPFTDTILHLPTSVWPLACDPSSLQSCSHIQFTFLMRRKSSCLKRMPDQIQECSKLLNFNFSQSAVTLTKGNVISRVTRLKQQLLWTGSCVWDGTWEWEWTEEDSCESRCEYQKNNKPSEWGG